MLSVLQLTITTLAYKALNNKDCCLHIKHQIIRTLCVYSLLCSALYADVAGNPPSLAARQSLHQTSQAESTLKVGECDASSTTRARTPPIEGGLTGRLLLCLLRSSSVCPGTRLRRRLHHYHRYYTLLIPFGCRLKAFCERLYIMMRSVLVFSALYARIFLHF